MGFQMRMYAYVDELVDITLREITPEARARGFVDLANLCYAMADKTLRSQIATECLAVVISVGQYHSPASIR